MLYPASKTTVFFCARTKNVSSPAKPIVTPVLPTHQDEVLHRRGRHGELPSSNTSNSRGRAGLSNHPRHTLGHLGLIISDASYAMIAPPTADEPTLWVTPNAPGRAPATTDGTTAQISAARHQWEEDVQTYRTYTSVQQALKKQIISVFEPMYLDILNGNMVGYANISARDMLDHLFDT
jgi:hypothetical protein